MVTADTTTENARDIGRLDGIRQSMVADRGYIIVGFDDMSKMGRVTQILEKGNFRLFNADDDWLMDGKETHALHFAHEDRTDLLD